MERNVEKANERESFPVRFFLKSMEDWESYKEMQNILIVKGEDEAEYWSELIAGYVEDNLHWVGGKKIVECEVLLNELKERFGRELSRDDLKRFREKGILESGIDYFAASLGKSHRYDLDRCLEKIGAA